MENRKTLRETEMGSWLTTAELVEELQISRSTLHRYRKAGQFPRPRRVLGMLRWHLQDVRSYLRARSTSD